MTTWTKMIPGLVTTAASPHAPREARRLAMDQLMKLGEIVDRHIANLTTLRDAAPDKHEQCPDCGIRGGHAEGCEHATAVPH